MAHLNPRGRAVGTVERLTLSLLDGAPDHPICAELIEWLTTSSRFRAFAERHHDKIRKKLRTAADAETARDLRAELLAARLLLSDRRIGLDFEAYGSTRGGPDFTVKVSGERPFNLEVTRLRGDPARVTYGGPMLPKLRQLPPSVPNALLIAVDGDRADAFDTVSAVRAIRARADARDDAFFARHGFRGARAFYDRFLRLGAVLVWCERAAADARATAWINGSARIQVPEPALRACIGCFQRSANQMLVATRGESAWPGLGGPDRDLDCARGLPGWLGPA